MMQSKKEELFKDFKKNSIILICLTDLGFIITNSDSEQKVVDTCSRTSCDNELTPALQTLLQKEQSSWQPLAKKPLLSLLKMKHQKKNLAKHQKHPNQTKKTPQ